MKKTRYILLTILSLILVANTANAQLYNKGVEKRYNSNPQIRLGIRAGFNMSDLTSAKGLDIWNGLAYFDKNSQYIGFTDTKPFKYGFNFGITAQGELIGNWYWQGSLIFTTKGYKLSTQNVDIDATADYMQIPIDIMYKYPLKDNCSLVASLGAFLGVGVYGYTKFFDHYGENDKPRLFHEAIQEPYINEALGTSNLIGCDYSVHGENVYWSDKDDTFSSDGTWLIDGGLQVGLGIEFWRMQFMINYQYSLTPLYDYKYDFSGRYQERGENYHNSFEYFNIKAPSSPRQNVFSFTLTYFFDNWNHGIRF